jgi:hypothetical protein
LISFRADAASASLRAKSAKKSAAARRNRKDPAHYTEVPPPGGEISLLTYQEIFWTTSVLHTDQVIKKHNRSEEVTDSHGIAAKTFSGNTARGGRDSRNNADRMGTMRIIFPTEEAKL